jgi:uncharacterized protein
VIDYIKEVFQQFTDNAIDVGTRSNDDEIKSFYSKLQSQADRGLLDEQFMKTTPHKDIADLFEEFHSIRMVEEEESKSRYTNEEKLANTSSIGAPLHNKLIKSTTLKLKEINDREIWSEESLEILDILFHTGIYEQDLDATKKFKSKLGKQFDYIWLEDNHQWYWLATGFVNAMIATHYRVMFNANMRTINSSQSRNIGELVIDSLKMTWILRKLKNKWTDEVYANLGTIAMTSVVLGDLPPDTNLEIKGMFDAGPRGGNFQAATLIPAENASPIFNQEKFPKEPCVGMSSFHLDNETPKHYAVTSDTIWGLYWIFRVIQITFPLVRDNNWLKNDGHSLSSYDDKDKSEKYIEDYQETLEKLEVADESESLGKKLTEIFRSHLDKAFMGNAESQTILGLAYLQTSLVNKNHAKSAINWLTKAAEQNYDKAQHELGLLYFYGEILTLDYEKAISWFTKAAEQGLDSAQYSLGQVYLKVEHLTVEPDLAVYWFKKAAEQGYLNALYELGLLYRDGRIVKQDYDKALTWFKKAAEQGHPGGQNGLGIMTSFGQGITQDYDRAFSWFKKAAEQGDSVGQNNVGCCYKDGEGVTQDYEKAFTWLMKSAEQGYHSAQLDVGDMFLHGVGVKKSIDDAAHWINLARNNPDREAFNSDEINKLEELWTNNELSKYLE